MLKRLERSITPFMELKQVIARIPIPFCGVALAVAALGLILEQWSPLAWAFCGCLRLPFYPTYAAMTFPFVIVTAASFKFAALLQGNAPIEAIGIIQTIIACIAVCYVLVRYVRFLLGPR